MDIKTDVNTVNLKKVKKGDIVKFRHGGIDIILAKKKSDNPTNLYYQLWLNNEGLEAYYINGRYMSESFCDWDIVEIIPKLNKRGK